MKAVPVQEAVGMVLCHDLTQIIPGQVKKPLFKKGHVVMPEDIPRLLDIGKEHLYVWEMREGILHENEAAIRMASAAAGHGLILTEPCEGKVNIVAAEDGLLKINKEVLFSINDQEQVMFATLHSNQLVKKNKVVAGTRSIPLVIDEKIVINVENMCREYYPLLQIKPLKTMRVGLVTTGSEVYHGRIKDKFGPVVAGKLVEWGSEVARQILVSDSIEMIVAAIKELIGEGVDMIMVTGGMSVDPDDVTPAGVVAAGGRIVSYGAPILPGAMFMMAYIDELPVMGLPGCVMYHRNSVFDLIAPRVLAGEKITRRDIAALGYGGLCSNCRECRFPDCSFGKGN
ncbi:molybdenum cofactor synthesis domain-containing protein [Desulfotomaculum arcticum]|uniref:Molybdopterin molybdenumtransferase n=1 Tax=Desulfotruncus arcticus DSM 17038 TaxID=1121424 RepID=A0A1I2QWD1_9FIRM|nr:molybdopterin-binding protein [Desulfotruncus arcticus]SFG29961.1 molybdenum cofactor synthesis domain-containing protein [Desulfotomaculum arcticum] [Desulfotruncus arcticus DSM 17038]